MTDPADLSRLDFRELMAGLPERFPRPSSLAPHQWLWLVGMLNNRTMDEAAALGPADWPATSRAMVHALATAEAAGGIDHAEHVSRRLHLTAGLLDRVGPDPAVPIRDPGEAVALILANLPVSLAEATRLAPGWRELPIPEIRRLRAAKRLLIPGRTINAHAHDPRIDAWAEVLPRLP